MIPTRKIAWPGLRGQVLMKPASYLERETLSRRAEVGMLLAVLILALGLRVAYLSVTGVWGDPPRYDGIEYDSLATHLLSGQGFATTAGQPYGFRSPGFPFFLTLLYALFGHSYSLVRLANVWLGALTCLLAYIFVKRVWRWQTGIIASLGVAVHPLLVYLTGIIYPECLILFLVAVVFVLAIKAARSRRVEEMVPLALVSGYLVYLRPSLLLFGLAQTVWVWLSYETVRKRLLASVVLVVLIILVIAPWSVRNFLVFDKFVWMSTNGGITLWASNNPLADGGWIEPSPATWLGPDPPADLRGWPGLTETENEARFRAEAMNWIRGHPAEFLSLLPRKLIRAWSLNFGNEARQTSLPAAVSVAYSVFLVMGLAGFVLSLARWRDLVALYLLIIVSTLTTLVFYGSTRQSSVLALPLVIFASLVLDRALSFVLSHLSNREESKER
jgi:4-amino-4-deoxy-L-arabinose transferase-like glycosyltransferase